MSESVNLKLFLPMLLAGVLVMSGVSVKNSGMKLWGQEMMLPRDVNVCRRVVFSRNFFWFSISSN